MPRINARQLGKKFQQKHPNLDLEHQFCIELERWNLEDNFIREHRFAPGRKFRFDFADIPNKIAVEIEGAVHTYGRHTRGKGYVSDCKKYNLATRLGWRVLRYTSIEDMRQFHDDYTTILTHNKPKEN